MAGARTRRWRLAAFVTISLSLLASSILADDLALLTLSDQAQALTATQMLGHAYGRTGNSFLVALQPGQAAKLAAAGMTATTIVSDARPEEFHLILAPSHPDAAAPEQVRRAGELIDLGSGLRIMRLSASAAASLSADGVYRTRPLDEVAIRFLYRLPTTAVAQPADFPTDTLVDRVNQDSIYTFNQRLQDFETRYVGTDSNAAARDWIASKFEDWGYTAEITPLSWYSNVEVVKLGYAEPEKVIVIGGHFDSFNQDSSTTIYAPGADDDGSGTVVTMELARVLADVPLRKTIIFIPFDAEEVGLVGSEYEANRFADQGTDLEVMYNFDMVGFTANSVWDINLSADDNVVYRDLTAAAANRVTSLIPLTTAPGGSSDHYYFMQQGFDIVNTIETDFNSVGWHHNADVTSRMNFPYLTEVVKMALASVAIVAESPAPVVIDNIVDVGDGDALEVHWSECGPDVSFWVYWGVQSGIYTDSLFVPAGSCSATITGLTEGTRYYVLVTGVTPNGYRSLHGVQRYETPLVIPRTPSGFAGSSSASELLLQVSWRANREADLSHYNLYRQIGPYGDFNLYQQGLIDTSFDDTGIMPKASYTYRVTAVDLDGHESAPTAAVSLYPATFDGGIVVIDSYLKEQTSFPSQETWEAWLDTVFGGLGIGVVVADSANDAVTVSDVGRYSMLFWMDDDFNTKTISASGSTLGLFCDRGQGVMVSGWKTIINWSPKDVLPGHLLYDEFGIDYYSYLGIFDFVGAVGQNGWPSVQIDPARGMDAWRDIAYLDPVPGAQVLCTFDSNIDWSGTEGKPVGVAYENEGRKRVLFTFPIYNLTASSASALLAKVVEYFGGVTQYDHGDLDHSGTIDIGDLTILIDHLFITLEPLAYPDEADMDGRPEVSIGDAWYLVRYLFLGGPAPAPMP